MEDIDYENGRFKVQATTIYGGSTESDIFSFDYLANPNIEVSSKSNVPGWTCVRSAENGFTVGTGDTFLEVWAKNPEGEYFDYYQELKNIPNGVYRLSAVCFNSTDGVTTDYVNGNVGLYAIAEGQEYFASVEEDGKIDYEKPLVIGRILVRDGSMRVGVKNNGPMTARWAGADDFDLQYLGTEEEVLGDETNEFIVQVAREAQQRRMSLMTFESETSAQAAELFVNPRCQRGESYGWTVNNLGVAKDEAYDGDTQNYYWNQWNASGLSSSMSQTITQIPDGRYTLGVMLRSSTNVDVELIATRKSGSETKIYQTHYTGTGATSPSGSVYKKGWQQVTLPLEDILWGDTLQVDVKAKGNNTGAWWSIDEWTLSWSPSELSSVRETELSEGVRIVYHGHIAVDVS